MDWTLVVITIVMFLLVVLILKHFFLKPVLKILDERKQALTNAHEKAQAQRDEAEKILQDAEDQAREVDEKARNDAQETVRLARRKQEEMLRESKVQSMKIIQKAKDDLHLERKRSMRSHRRELTDLAMNIAAKVLEREVDEKEHERLVDRFLDDLEGK